MSDSDYDDVWSSRHHGHVRECLQCDHNNSTWVKNLHGTSAERYKIDRLYGKYLEEGGTEVGYCQVKGCKRSPSATAHVIFTDGRRTADWQLTRLCAHHNHPAYKNKYGSSFPLRKGAALIPVRDITIA